MKGYKVTDSQRTKLVGVASASLTELEEKGRQKLGLTGDLILAMEDGALLQDQDYFLTIPAQSLIIFYRIHEPIITGVDIIVNALKRVNATYLQVSAEAAEVMEGKAHELSALLSSVGTNAKPLGNTRDDDPVWFEGLETNAKTKEEFMFKKAQDRIRGYLYKFQDDVRKTEVYKTPATRKVLTDCLETFKKRLAADGYFGCYFDRRYASTDLVDCGSKRKKKRKLKEAPSEDSPWKLEKKISYCDTTGLFTCEGLWKMNYCAYSLQHSINPYVNRESRVIFSTWNLDHRIEKSRTILPAVLFAVQSKKEKNLNVDYFYRLLFTRANLKLVHIVCHDKTSHDLVCDHSLLFLPA